MIKFRQKFMKGFTGVNNIFYYYDIPSMTGINLPLLELLGRVHERIPAFAGLKFSNPDLLTFQPCYRC